MSPIPQSPDWCCNLWLSTYENPRQQILGRSSSLPLSLLLLLEISPNDVNRLLRIIVSYTEIDTAGIFTTQPNPIHQTLDLTEPINCHSYFDSNPRP